MISGKDNEQMKPVTGEALIALIPQKEPFVFISRLLAISEKKCKTAFAFGAGHVLCGDGVLSAPGLVENIAQTCAAKVGYEYFLRGKKLPNGFIGDIKDFSFSRLPLAGEEIITEITIEHELLNVMIISGSVELDNEEIARCTMKIYIEPEPSETLAN